MDGRIFQINCSNGGVPELAVRESRLTQTGLDCNRQAHPNIHGGPERAVRLYSLEKILELQMEGHPIFPGSVGEKSDAGRSRVGESQTRLSTPYRRRSFAGNCKLHPAL